MTVPVLRSDGSNAALYIQRVTSAVTSSLFFRERIGLFIHKTHSSTPCNNNTNVPKVLLHTFKIHVPVLHYKYKHL